MGYERDEECKEERRKLSFRVTVMGAGCVNHMDEATEEEVESDDDSMIDEDDGLWFSMDMTNEEKRKTNKPWRMSVIVKLLE